jgi:hypothetical protein
MLSKLSLPLTYTHSPLASKLLRMTTCWEVRSGLFLWMKLTVKWDLPFIRKRIRPGSLPVWKRAAGCSDLSREASWTEPG